MTARQTLFGVAAAILAALSLFFTWYTVRLLYINLAVPEVAAHRQTGMYIGAMVFPIAAVGFGWLCVRCWKRARS